MLVRASTAAVYFTAFFVKCSFDIDVNVSTMQLINVVCDEHALCVVPWPITYAVACTDSVGDLKGRPPLRSTTMLVLR